MEIADRVSESKGLATYVPEIQVRGGIRIFGSFLKGNVEGEFLSYILSRDGQQVIDDLGIFSPLPATVADEQRARL